MCAMPNMKHSNLDRYYIPAIKPTIPVCCLFFIVML
jgi:hypothetical protein